MKISIVKTVTVKSGRFTITRTRDSDGYAGISITKHNVNVLTIDNNKKTGFGDEYEQAAYNLSQALDEVCNNRCLLPESKGGS